MGIVFQNNILHHILRHLLTIFFRHDAKRESQQVGGGGIIAIEDGVGIERVTGSKTGAFFYGQELAIEGLGHVLADGLPMVCLASPLLQQLHGANDVGRRNECSVRLAGRILGVDKFQALRWHTPVAILVLGDDAILHIFFHQVLQPALDVEVRLVNSLAVAKLSP